jgi:hypothetical protein
MTIQRAIATIISCMLVLAIIGAGIGCSLGKFAPGYYRGVFSSDRQPGFDPVSVGFGLGLTQGAAGGVAVGLVVVGLFCWRDVRLHRGSDSTVASNSIESISLPQRMVLVTGSLFPLGFFLVAGALIGMIIGTLLGQGSLYYRRYLEEQEILSPILASDPAFSGVEINERSDGGVYLTGDLPTPPDLARLRERIIRAVGETRSKDVMRGVSAER